MIERIGRDEASAIEAWNTRAAIAAPPGQEDAKDAARYRWLRSTTNWASSNGERVDVRNNPQLWDSAIDACISKAAAPDAQKGAA
jgi:hypothetical protein